MDGFTFDNANSATIIKDPDAVLDYGWDWTLWLAGPDGTDTDTISNQTVSCDAGLNINGTYIVGGKIVVWLSGGTVGATYNITCEIVTAKGRTDDRSFSVVVQEK